MQPTRGLSRLNTISVPTTEDTTNSNLEPATASTTSTQVLNKFQLISITGDSKVALCARLNHQISRKMVSRDTTNSNLESATSSTTPTRELNRFQLASMALTAGPNHLASHKAINHQMDSRIKCSNVESATISTMPTRELNRSDLISTAVGSNVACTVGLNHRVSHKVINHRMDSPIRCKVDTKKNSKLQPPTLLATIPTLVTVSMPTMKDNNNSNLESVTSSTVPMRELNRFDSISMAMGSKVACPAGLNHRIISHSVVNRDATNSNLEPAMVALRSGNDHRNKHDRPQRHSLLGLLV